MTTEHRDKFRFSYLIIAHCSTFSKDKLHYYYASFFLTSSPINCAYLPPPPPTTPCAILTSSCKSSSPQCHPILATTLKSILFYLLNLMRTNAIFGMSVEWMRMLFLRKMITHLRILQLSFLLATQLIAMDPSSLFFLSAKGTKHSMWLQVVDVLLWLQWPVYKK